MKRSLYAALLILFLNCVPAQAGFKGEANDYFAFAAIGPLFSPDCFRLGYNDWEGGLLGTGTPAIGVDKLFRLGAAYVAFGPALGINFRVATVGFYAAAGFEALMFWGLTFRGELNATGMSDGTALGSAVIGLGLHI